MDQNNAVTKNNTGTELTLSEWQLINDEIREQPAWRRDSDILADYYDGNQLDSETLQAMQALGMAPIIENLMAPAIDSVLGLEAKNRVDCLVTSQSDGKYSDIAEAINQKLNEAERESQFDRACADAHAAQVKVGLGVVGIGREHDPFKYPHVAECVHRNECFWDWKAKTDLSDARYFLRRKWHDIDVLELAFPDQAELIQHSGSGWATGGMMELITEGGLSTGLARGFATETDRAWTMLEQEWREVYRRRLCLSEVWYRRWIRGKVLKSPDGRVVEYDTKNKLHVDAVRAGMLQPQEAMYSKTFLSWWIGPHKLADIPNPYKHGKIPYVLFYGKREDLSGVPYGLGRPMKSMQDEINARNTKMQWLLVAKRVIMTKGVADPTDTRNEASRPDAVHVLDPVAMRNGGTFKVESDFQLNSQQYQALVDKREALKNVAGIYKAFEGQNSSSTSGLAINSLVEQSTQTLAEINDNFRMARASSAELLLANVMEEIGDQEMEIEIKGHAGANGKTIVINQRTQDDRGCDCLNNDLQRARLKIALSDIPSTASYRKQRFMLLSQLAQTLPPQLQAIMLPYIIDASDEPERESIIKDIRKALGQQNDGPPKTPEEAAQQQAAQQQAQAAAELQARVTDLELREREAKVEAALANVQKILADIKNPAAVQVAEINANNKVDLAVLGASAESEKMLNAEAMAHVREEWAEDRQDDVAENQQPSTLQQPAQQPQQPQGRSGLPMPTQQPAMAPPAPAPTPVAQPGAAPAAPDEQEVPGEAPEPNEPGE